MRIAFVLALTAATALAACNETGKPGAASSARAPVGAATPAADAKPVQAAANCPTVQPACPVARKAHGTTGTKMRSTHRAHVRHAAHRPTASAAPVRRHAQVDVHRGLLPPRPYRYDELQPEPREGREDRYAYREDDGTRFHHPHRHHGEGRYHDPEPRDRDADVEPRRPEYDSRREYRHEEQDGYEDRRADGHREHREHRYAPPPSRRYEERRARAYEGGEMRETRRRDEYESYSEQSSSSSSYSEQRDCCAPRAQAAGFDERGYLTWPGKTPR